MSFQDEIAALGREAEAALRGAGSLAELLALKARFLGRKGGLAGLLKQLPTLPPPERGPAGRLANEVKERLERLAAEQETAFQGAERADRLLRERTDVTLPGRRPPLGRLHPVTQVAREIQGVFLRLGFDVVEGPDVELDAYNFEALNIPRDHPARDMQDTLYVTDEVLLRTHTSPVQIRTMEKHPPPVKIICPGRVYRADAVDPTHSPMFHQIEGLMVDRGVTMAHLKGVLTLFAHEVFGLETGVRFKPSFFPFVEPGAEVGIRCVICGGQGCRVCKQTGWLEVLGAGMVHPQVFRNVGYDPEEVTGFAFGMGVERIAMLKYGIDDIRLFFENDVRFLEQF
ncbi:MAG: phenylalanine--tRNA ligase subunit alpha [Deltaproteobacteria bacterium]|nr:phenylalanine--tRNA ligase subunit alpha [Deltaproteobacteria bacterium]